MESKKSTALKISPIVVGLAAGLYPVLFYYSNNYPLINSWKHLGFFICFFLLVPIVVCFVGYRIFGWKRLKPFQKYLLPFLSLSIFLSFMQISIFATLKLWITLGIIAISGVLAFFLYKHLKKIAIMQFILAGLGLFTLVPIIIQQLSYSDVWMEQPDSIEEVVFKSKPNIYMLQPDGYVNFTEIDKGYYQLDNTEFKSFLEGNDFKLYDDFRSNYNATIPSNMATLTMKHHYYNSGFNLSEVINGREVIVESNPVLKILKNNGYKTHLLLEWPYLIANQPQMGYDYCNFTNEDISLIGTGYSEEKDL